MHNRVNTTLLIGCTDTCGKLFDDWFPSGTNFLRVLVKPALAALGLVFEEVKTSAPKKFDGNLREDSMAAQLANAYDTFDRPLSMTSSRFQVLNSSFSYPIALTHLACLTPRHLPPALQLDTLGAFLIQPFEPSFWGLSCVFLYILFSLSTLSTWLKSPLSTSLLALLIEVYLSLICGFYSAELTSTALPTANTLGGVPSFAFLAGKIAAGRYRMVIHSVDDFRFEFINQSVSADIVAMRKALARNPPIIVKDMTHVCRMVAESGKAGVPLFTLFDELQAATFCSQYLAELVVTPIPNQSPIFLAFVFSKRAETVKRKINEYAAQGLFDVELIRDSRRLAAINRARRESDDTARNPLSTFDILQAFWIVAVGMPVALVAFWFEKRRRG